MRAVNLLPDRAPERGSRPASAAPASSAPTYAVLGVLGLVLLAMVAFVVTRNSVADQQAELARAQVEAKAAQAEAAALKPYGDFATLAAQRVQTVSQLASSRFDWEQALRDLSRAVPGDVNLTSIDGTVAPGVKGGGGSSSLRGAIPSPAIQLTGCTSSQTAVARVMSRLRTMRGVTRVSLQKSSKADTEGGVATPDGGQPCPKGSPPEFDLVVFFEKSEAKPASDASAAAAPSATPAASSTAQPASTTTGSAP